MSNCGSRGDCGEEREAPIGVPLRKAEESSSHMAGPPHIAACRRNGIRAVLLAAVAVVATSAPLAQNRDDAESAGGASRHLVPLFARASDPLRQGFARVVNRSDEAGEVSVLAVDDGGNRFGPVTLAVGAGATVHFNSADLENGNPGKGLSGGVGAPGEGDWRLELESSLDFEAHAYLRTLDGFLTAMHDLAPESGGTHRVPTFNPGSNERQESLLRLVNDGDADVAAAVRGVDDHGRSPGGEVRVAVPAGASRTLSAAQLESGDGPGVVAGALGDGAGKWRLAVTADGPVKAMSLLDSPTGTMTNLSTAPPRPDAGDPHRVPLFPPAADPFRQGFVRVVNRSDEAGEVSVRASDDSGWDYEAVTLSVGANRTVHFNSDDLERGNPAKGLSAGVGAGEGDWRLALSSELDIEVLAYIRTGDGFLTSMHDLVPTRGDEHLVATFNPGSNDRQVSLLRLVNDGDAAARVTISGVDDRGAPGRSAVSATVPAGRSLTLSAAQLESGDGDGIVGGALGDGAGKWRLAVASDRPVRAMSLLRSPTGHLANLSTAPNETAAEFFAARVSPVVQAKCVNCHVEGGVSGSTRLVFVRSENADHLALNRQAFADFLAEAEDGAELILNKIQGVAHGGGVQAAAGTEDYASIQRYLELVGGTQAEAGETFRDCAECPEMVAVPSGTFTMGTPAWERGSSDERPMHVVRVPSFAVGVYEVTFDEWDACVAGGGCRDQPVDADWGRGRRPVIFVDWDDSQQYVEWLSSRTGERYRLPSESEWEYAARAGTTTPFHTGETITTDQANYNGYYLYPSGDRDPFGLYRARTVPVGSFGANAWGLHDVHGNVDEWVQDCVNANYEGAPADGSAWVTGDCRGRILRGGSWIDWPSSLRVANRHRIASDRAAQFGFRVARTLGGTYGAPTVATAIANRSLAIGRDATLDLSDRFADDQTLVYEVRSSDAEVVRVNVTGGVLTLMPVAEGSATVTVTARDPDGNEATQTFSVAVGPSVETFRDCDACPEMVVVPAGTFMMGAPESETGSLDHERPVHAVTVSSFAVGAYEVTFDEWDACVGCRIRPHAEGWGRGRRPVINVTWHDAQRYVEWLSSRTGERYRLPSESEWEYAARAGTTTPFHTGETITTEQANYDGRRLYPSGDRDPNRLNRLWRRQTVPVGSFDANAFGLHDVHGNVWEWVQDCWNANYEGAPADGSAWLTGGFCRHRVSRGGSWYDYPSDFRAAVRFRAGPLARGINFGFRVARTLTP